jgi:hypothetical protein
MILRRVAEHVKAQNWFAVAIDFVIVVVGVFIGIQVANWNEARAAEYRRAQIVEALVTDLNDAIIVQEQGHVHAIGKGLAAWDAAHMRSEHPAPFYFRIEGSDTAPNTWTVLRQMEIAGLFDPVTIFDLNFYYSELDGVGRKYIRYVSFVEREILPYEKGDPLYFYTADGTALKPEYQASMDRLQEYRGEVRRLSRWAACLTGRLESDTRPTESCVRTDPTIREYSLLALPFSEEETK